MVNDIYDFVEGEERKKYAKKYGISSLINYFHGLPWNNEESEKVYKECNEKGITWEDFYGITKNNNFVY